ncbi:hypothetical protein [Mycobacterium sp.]|uniref:hypothetical protein n=1 Tax=Mycobacterium sp. TaxID=1785 RepID=UPI003C706BC7
MSFSRICGFAIAGAAAGAMLGAALLASPMAYADDVATLPVPPFNPFQVSNVNAPLGPPGLTAVTTNEEWSTIPGGEQLQYDEAWTLSDGSYETHQLDDVYGIPESYFEHDSTVVTASEGVAPPVGTEWDTSIFWLPSWGYSQELFINYSLTTSAGTVDVLSPQYIPLLAAWSNEFYNGPAGIFDDLVSNNGAAVIPIIDIPADTSSAAAADFSTLWSDLLGTL